MIRLIAVLALAGSAVATQLQSAEAAELYQSKEWLSAHANGGSPGDIAGMQDLKNTDPNAFAVVQALLTKQSMGLLDPSNPSASFADGAGKKMGSFAEEAEKQGLTN